MHLNTSSLGNHSGEFIRTLTLKVIIGKVQVSDVTSVGKGTGKVTEGETNNIADEIINIKISQNEKQYFNSINYSFFSFITKVK